MPDELEEAAYLEGANIWTIFFKIMLPLAKSGLVALGIFTALFAFKDLMWPLIVNTSIDKMPLAPGLANLQGQYATNFPQLMAGSLLAIWPIVVIFIVFQRKFIEGIATTGGNFAKEMEEVCPNAWLLNYTNPMAMLTMGVLKATSIKTVGLCHSVQVCVPELFEHLGIADQYDLNDFQWKIAGINHMACFLL
ncbi:hypothetical protein EfmAA242_31460 (plasmid) [Enterococcus faecium]|nr:hypothetical protein EfmAA242_31460 [Enterococcus faecium]